MVCVYKTYKTSKSCLKKQNNKSNVCVNERNYFKFCAKLNGNRCK